MKELLFGLRLIMPTDVFTSKEKNVTDKVASKNNKTKSIKLDLPLCLSKAIRVQCRQLFAFLSIISPNVVNLGSFGQTAKTTTHRMLRLVSPCDQNFAQ